MSSIIFIWNVHKCKILFVILPFTNGIISSPNNDYYFNRQIEKSSSSTTFIPQARLLHNHVLPHLPLIFRHGRNELRIYWSCSAIFQVSRFTLFAALAKWYPWKIHCKNICRNYGRIQIHVAGNRLPRHATFFFTGTHKNYLALRKASYLRQRSGISCNNVNMSTHLYPLPRSRPNKSFYAPPSPHP